jgi:PAS domain S-box-containing protein/putative nucleotidyltransferase with HDIG domain
LPTDRMAVGPELHAGMSGNEYPVFGGLEHGPLVGVAIYSADGQCKYANEHAGRILGMDPSILLRGTEGKPSLPAAIQLTAHANEVLRQGTGFRKIMPMVGPTGELFQIDWSIERLPLEGPPRLLIWFADITPFAHLERALRRSRERYRQLVDETPDLVFSLDLEGRLATANQALAAVVGRSVNEVIGRNLGDIGLPSELSRRWGEVLDAVLRTCEPAELETTALMPDGDLKVLALTMRPLFEGERSPIGVRAYAHDITKRWQAELAAQKSEQQLRILTEKAPVAMLIAGDQGMVYTNPMFLEMFGFEHDQLAGYRLLDLAVPTEQEAIYKKAFRLWRQEIPGITLDLMLRRPDNTEFPAHLHLSRVELSDGPAMVAFITDLTERRRAEESRLFTRYSVDHAVDEVIWLTRDGRVSDASESTWRGLGYTREEFLEASVFDFDARASPATWAKCWQGVRKNENVTFESTQISRSGRRIPVEVKANYLTFAGEEFICAFVRDISDRKQVEHELRETAKRLSNIVESAVNALSMLSEYRDPYTAGHQQRVAHLAVAIAERLGLASEQVESLRIASILHDIGKIAVPIEILSKPGSITPHELGLIRTHSQIGFEILKDIDFPWPVARIVLQHHECMDGSGYPAGLCGDEIMIEARILSVADTVEAMSSHRPYRPALTRQEMWRTLDETSQRFDMDVVKACRAVLRRGLWS